MTVYYLDPSALGDTHSGLKETGKTITSSADTTHFVDTTLSGADDYLNGDFFWNLTRNAGSAISDYVSSTQEVTLSTAITGMAAGDSYYMIHAKKTIAGVKSMVYGDIAYIRAGTTLPMSAQVTFDNSGEPTAFISLIGLGNGTTSLETTDGTATEAWHDASVVIPILSYTSGSRLVVWYDYFWRFENLDIRNGSAASQMDIEGGHTIVKNVKFDNCTTTALFIDGPKVRVEDCTFTNGSRQDIMIGGNSGSEDTYIKNCFFDGWYDGSPWVDMAINFYNLQTGNIYFDHCTSQNHIHGFTRPTMSSACLHFRDFECTDTDGLIDWWGGIGDEQSRSLTGYVFRIEDWEHNYGAAYNMYSSGEIISDSLVIRDGGATTSAKFVPMLFTTVPAPLCISGNMYDPDIRVWAKGSDAVATIYIRGYGWTTFPTAQELYVEAEYLSSYGVGTITRQLARSDEVLVDNTNWVAFNCSINPAEDSMVNIKVYLGKYEASSGIYVDIKPVLT